MESRIYGHICLPILQAALILTGIFGSSRTLEAAPLTRGEAVRLALEANPALELSRQQWLVMKALVVQRSAFPEPELELEYEQMPSGINPGAYGERSAGINQRLELPHKRYLQLRSASERASAARWGVYQAKANEITAAVKLAFDRLVLRESISGHARENLGLAREIYEKANVRFKAGEVAQLEVLRADVELARAEARLTEAESQMAVAAAELNTLLARDIKEPVEPAAGDELQAIEIDLESLVDSALVYRPELKGARARLAAAGSEKILASASFMPDLTLGIYRQKIRSTIQTGDYWRARIGFELPLWAAFSVRGRVMEASAVLRREEAALEDAERTVYLELERARQELNSASRQAGLYRERILREAEQAYVFAVRSYEEGKTGYLELLEAGKTLTASRIEYSQKLYDYRAAMTYLELASGCYLFESH